MEEGVSKFKLLCSSKYSLSSPQQSSMLVSHHTSMDQAGDGATGVVGTTLYLAPELFLPATLKYSQVPVNSELFLPATLKYSQVPISHLNNHVSSAPQEHIHVERERKETKQRKEHTEQHNHT